MISRSQMPRELYNKGTMPARNKKNFRSTKSGAGMTRAGVKAYRRLNPKLTFTSGTKEMEMLKKKKTIKKVVKALKKASKAHAGQAKMLKGVLNGKKKRS
jgi:hypothetical protein